MNLLIDEIRTFKEFTIRGCREVKFGHRFLSPSLSTFVSGLLELMFFSRDKSIVKSLKQCHIQNCLYF